MDNIDIAIIRVGQDKSPEVELRLPYAHRFPVLGATRS